MCAVRCDRWRNGVYHEQCSSGQHRSCKFHGGAGLRLVFVCEAAPRVFRRSYLRTFVQCQHWQTQPGIQRDVLIHGRLQLVQRRALKTAHEKSESKDLTQRTRRKSGETAEKDELLSARSFARHKFLPENHWSANGVARTLRPLAC